MMNETFLGCAPNRTHLFFKDYTSNALEAMRRAAGSTPKPKPKPRPRPKPNPAPTPTRPNAAGSTDAWRGGSRAAIKHKAVCVHPTRSSSTLQPYVTRAATLCGPGERQLQRVLAAGASGCGPASADVAEPPRSMVKVP